jgi:uncharacterized protein YuzE
MKLHYYPDTDSLYIEFRADESRDSREIEPGIVADFDAAGHLVGLDIDQARHKVDLTSLDTIALPKPAA